MWQLLVGIAAAQVLLTAYPGGPPIRRTGAPGEGTYLAAACHVGVAIPDSPLLRLDVHTYAPGGSPQRWTLRADGV